MPKSNLHWNQVVTMRSCGFCTFSLKNPNPHVFVEIKTLKVCTPVWYMPLPRPLPTALFFRQILGIPEDPNSWRKKKNYLSGCRREIPDMLCTYTAGIGTHVCTVPVPVRHQYRYRTLWWVRSGINIGTGNFGKFGVTSIPVPDTSVSSVRYRYRYRTCLLYTSPSPRD